MTVLRGLSDEQVDQMVRKNQKSFEITVDVSPSARAALIEKKCGSAAVRTFKKVNGSGKNIKNPRVEICAIDFDPLIDMGDFSTKARLILNALMNSGLPQPTSYRITHEQSSFKLAIRVSVNWIEEAN